MNEKTQDIIETHFKDGIPEGRAREYTIERIMGTYDLEYQYAEQYFEHAKNIVEGKE